MQRIFVGFLLSIVACGGTDAPPPNADPVEGASMADSKALKSDVFAKDHKDYASYWQAGLAEITRFELTQTRYGQPRKGDAVFVFVTEPFLVREQVKHELPDGKPDTTVLKLNATRTFKTGVYPYNIMTSSFVPVDGEAGLKVSSTVTEWCGMAFAQLNRRDGKVSAELRSYFQAEGDQNTELADVPFEDALWQELRRDPSALPVGDVTMVPAMHSLRLYHQPLKPYAGQASLKSVTEDGKRFSRYRIEYPDIDRVLSIDFDSTFPHALLGFEEVHRGEKTVGLRTHSIMDAYWGHNGNEDGALRKSLGLP